MRYLHIFFILSFHVLIAQQPPKLNSVEIYNAIEKLNFLGSVLYIAAHPDDENTRLISYYANQEKAETAYLSLTRGDGGQNLIGPELRELLGVIRTQELLAARKIDGGMQFFTRANDFGYSKHPDETLQIWNKEEVLQDMVTVIRKFKPDVIINRFNHRTPGTTHGHHTSSAMLSLEAFDLAGDETFQTIQFNKWQPKRLFFNTSWWFYGSRENFENADKSNLLSINTGVYFSERGISNSEIAALSRSEHKSQGFGSTGDRGDQLEYLELIKGELPTSNSIFEGINTSWSRVKGGEQISSLITRVLQEYDFTNPSKSIEKLIEIYTKINDLEDSHWKKLKLEELKTILLSCAGLYIESITSEPNTTHNSTIKITTELVNRSNFDISLISFKVAPINFEENQTIKLNNNIKHVVTSIVEIPQNAKITAPYWLLEEGSLGMYKFSDTSLIGLPETPRYLTVEYALDFNGVLIPFTKDVKYKYNDPVKGEVYQPFEILPEVSVSFEDKVYIFSDNKNQKIRVKVTANTEYFEGQVQLQLPESWVTIPASKQVKIEAKGGQQFVDFEVIAPNDTEEIEAKAMVITDNEVLDKELIKIDYEHIPTQSVLMNAKAKMVRLNLERKGQTIGYIQGAGDEIPTSLRQIGYTVVELDEENINPETIENFDAIVLGIRLYNISDKSKLYQQYLFDYVKNGGTLITQYNTSFRLKVDKVAPYSLSLSRDRVTDENSNVTFINPTHEILNYPNKLTSSDFEGWVQERGLYFPNKWDENFTPIISINDINEKPTQGSLLVAKYGEGNFIYSGLSFFRELPAGVSGAYKLFTNMLSVGKNKTEKPIKN